MGAQKAGYLQFEALNPRFYRVSEDMLSFSSGLTDFGFFGSGIDPILISSDVASIYINNGNFVKIKTYKNCNFFYI